MQKQSAIVIGVGLGLGYALAEKFGRELGEVAMIARSQDRLSTMAKKLNDAKIVTHTFAADAADSKALNAAISKAAGAMSPVKAVIYNAALIQGGRPLEIAPAALAQSLAVDVIGALIATQAATPFLERAGGGSMLFTGGGLALHPVADYAGLAVGKAAMRNLAMTVRDELAPKGIRVATVTICRQILDDDSHYGARTIAAAYWRIHSDPHEPDFEMVYD